ncbi:MAG: hypothetical protein ABI665_15025 [Vicinamibacterales bacterium]
MTRLILTGVLIAAGLLTSSDLSACGEKFLIVGRGTRFQRASSARPAASILVYANPASNVPKALANVPVESVLKKAGYKPTTVSTASELESALNRGGWDLVVLDLADGQAVVGRMPVGDAAPALLPVAYNASGSDLANARKQFPRVLKLPTKSQSFLDAVDEALAMRPKVKGSPKADD